MKLLILLSVGMMIACIITLLWSSIMIYRNMWVFKNRMIAINDFFNPRIEALKRGEVVDDIKFEDVWLSYNEMMWRFWIWDIKKLKK